MCVVVAGDPRGDPADPMTNARTKAVVQATPEGILLKPVTAALIKRGRGIIKRTPGDQPLAEEWAAHKKEEKELEERHVR